MIDAAVSFVKRPPHTQGDLQIMAKFSNNPIATLEQNEHELLALNYFNHPDIISTRTEVKAWWLDEVKPSQTMRDCLEWAFEEVMFGATIWALNQDPLYPKVITISRLAHQLGNIDIPGSRWGIDNPDSVYRVIPISGEERYEIHGRAYQRRMVENYFTLWDDKMQTIGLLSGKDLVIDSEGYFTITVDSDPSNGRVNHIQSGDSAKEFYIRDVIFDWQNDRPNELSIVRLGDAPVIAPTGDSDLFALVTDYMHKWAHNTTRWNNQTLLKPVNDFSFTIDRDSDGALRNQIYIMGHFNLPDEDTVLVLDVDMGGADYFIAPITNVWGTSNEIRDRNGCLNKTQIEKNADGTYTLFLSLKDPGIRNWLDPSDMPEGILTLRWAEFNNDRPEESLGVRCRLTSMEKARTESGAEHKQFSAEQRASALQKRSDSYAWRLAE